MEENTIYLTFEQALFFIIKINEWSDDNNYNDQVVNKYRKDFISRSRELATMNPIKRLITGDEYKISKSMYNYLASLLNVDPLNDETKDYLVVVKNSLEETKKNKKQKLKNK